MPWNQGGGPWGSGGGNQGGGQNPWGRPSGGGGMQPPNVEDLLRKSQERLKRFMPGGMGSGKIIAIIVVVVAALWIASGFYLVSPSQQGLVLRFGEYNRPSGPGLNWHLPSPIESVIIINVEALNSTEIPGDAAQAFQRGVQNVDQREDVVVTGDENIIEVRFVVQWRVADARQFAFNVRRAPEGTRVTGSGDMIRGVAMSAIREVIAQMPAQRVLAEGRTQLATDTAAIMQRLLNSYQAGVQITQVQIRDINPPAQVVAAFRDVQSAQADRERLRNEAEAYRNTIVPTARGEAQRMMLEAEAFRQRAVQEAQGEAARFISVYEAYRLAPDVTTQRLYIETMEQILRNSNRVLIDQPPGSQGLLPFLPLPELRRAAPAQTPPAAGSPPGTPSTPTPPVPAGRGVSNISGGNRP